MVDRKISAWGWDLLLSKTAQLRLIIYEAIALRAAWAKRDDPETALLNGKFHEMMLGQNRNMGG